VAFDGSSTGETHENTRTLLTTTTGSIQLWQHDKMRWVREEALASIQVAEFVELPEKKVVMSHAAVDEEGYFERLQRQLSDAKVQGLHIMKSLVLNDFSRTFLNTWQTLLDALRLAHMLP
jgi:hypothetical protein